MATNLYEVDRDEAGRGRRLRFAPHHGQYAAWASRARFVGVLSGTQGGKTSFGPLWLHREVYGGPGLPGRGPGDYLGVTATYDLFKLKMLPALLELFVGHLGLGRYWAGDRILELRPDRDAPFLAQRSSDPMWARVILRSAEAGSGLESSTAKGAWLDEAGQDAFTGETWRAVLSRLSLNLGRVLVTTTLYNFGWLKTEFHDRWKAGDPDYEVVHFDSRDNPAFPAEEWDRARRSMPPWRFDLRYRGRYSRPAGLIYDSYHDEPAPAGHLVPRFDVPWTWPRYVGVDFGGSNTAAVYLAMEPATGLYYAYRVYFEGDRTTAEHTEGMAAGEPPVARAVGGSPSETQWRREFGDAGFPIAAPDVAEVEVGISRAYAAFKGRRVLVFDDLTGLRKELRDYSRKLGKDGEPTEQIEAKSRYHRLDALRYVLGHLMGPVAGEEGLRASANPLAGYRGTRMPAAPDGRRGGPAGRRGGFVRAEY